MLTADTPQPIITGSLILYPYKAEKNYRLLSNTLRKNNKTKFQKQATSPVFFIAFLYPLCYDDYAT